VNAIDLRGKLIAFEGIDTSGKSTQARLLEKGLLALGHDVVSTREPGGTRIGEAARSIVLSKPGEHKLLLPFSELLLFMVSRAQNTAEIIRPALDAGKTVIVARYRMSSLAYQGYGRGLDLKLIDDLNDAATHTLQPDITFLIDLPADVALRRKKTEQDRIEIEALEFHRRVRAGYLEMSESADNVIVINGDREIRAIEAEIAGHLGL